MGRLEKRLTDRSAKGRSDSSRSPSRHEVSLVLVIPEHGDRQIEEFRVPERFRNNKRSELRHSRAYDSSRMDHGTFLPNQESPRHAKQNTCRSERQYYLLGWRT